MTPGKGGEGQFIMTDVIFASTSDNDQGRQPGFKHPINCMRLTYAPESR